mmetsp:Transcript_104218/g.299665  ORF Transcript_104218/g.299665 Transcript_104218/m.299665 type:complete len:274 (+) Transcript_104218:330-1151(+)
MVGEIYREVLCSVLAWSTRSVPLHQSLQPADSAQHLQKDDTHRPHVAWRRIVGRVLVCHHHLRRHKGHGAGDVSHKLADGGGGSEIQHLQLRLFIVHGDVLRLEVSMDHAPAVAVRDGTAELTLQVTAPLERETAACILQDPEQRVGTRSVHSHENVAWPMKSPSQGDDVLVSHPVQEPHLLPQGNDVVHLSEGLFLDHLHSLQLLAVGIHGRVDGAEGAFSEHFLQPARPDLGARPGRGVHIMAQRGEAFKGAVDSLPEHALHGLRTRLLAR